jgi:hypothetical protein
VVQSPDSHAPFSSAAAARAGRGRAAALPAL